MTDNVYRILTAALIAATVAGCSKIERIEEVVEFAERATDVSEQQQRVLGNPLLDIDPLPGTAFEAVPTAGRAVYLGSAFLSIQNDNDRRDLHVLVGDSRVEIDFGRPADAVSGGVDNIRLTQIGDVSVGVPGSLRFDNGQIGGRDPNDLAFDFNGDVTIDEAIYQLGGSLSGKLRGTRTEPAPGEAVVRAYSVEDEVITVLTNAGDYSASMTVIGEN